MTAENNNGDTQHHGNGRHHGSKKRHHNKQVNGNPNASDEHEVQEEEAPSVPFSKLATHISSTIPILYDSATAVHDRVHQYPLGKYAIDKAGYVIESANRLTQPVQKHLQPHLKTIDDFSCRSVDKLAYHLPIVTKPTTEIVETITKPPLQVIDGVKAKIDSNITAPAIAVALTVNDKLTGVVDNVENYVDYWLPGSEAEPAHADEPNQAARVYKLSLDVSSRLVQRVNSQLERTGIPRSKEDLSKLAETNALLKNTNEKIQQLQATINEWVLLSAQAAKERLPTSVTSRVTGVYQQYEENIANKRLSELSADLLKQVQNITQHITHHINEHLQAHSPALAAFLKARFESLANFANVEYGIIRSEALRSDITTIQKARNIVNMTQEQVLPILHSSVEELQGQLKHYTTAATESKDKVIVDVKHRLNALGVSV